jgi:serine/threonine protein phosphatase PrpC
MKLISYEQMDKKRLHRHKREGCDGRRNISVFKWVVVGITFVFWVYLTTIDVPLPKTTLNAVSSPRNEQVWKPYQLSHREYSTGQLSYESFYTGSYAYEIVINDVDINRNFRIHFPIELDANDEKKMRYLDNDSAATCLWTHTGAKGYDVPNQDRSVVIDDSSVEGVAGWSLSAVFDGHGDFGHVTSHAAVTNLPALILNAALTETSWKAASHEFQNSIAEKIKNAFQKIDTTGPISIVPQGGSTAAVVLQLGRWVHIASVGDSTAVLVQWLKTNGEAHKDVRHQDNDAAQYRIIASAVRHKPSDPLERKRIEENGGLVYIPMDPSESSRVIFDTIDMDGKHRQTGLAMSRSLGDTPGKEQNVVVADPDVLSIDLNDYQYNSSQHFFVVLASDGVTDMVSLEDVLNDVGNALYNPDAQDSFSTTLALSNTCRMVVNSATKAWNAATKSQYRDDISLAVHRIL